MSDVNSVFESDDIMDVKKQIVEELLNTEKNLETKTELSKPPLWSLLKMIHDECKKYKLEQSAQIIEEYMQTLMKYLISNKRLGRTEYIQVVKALSQMQEKPMSNGMAELMK